MPEYRPGMTSLYQTPGRFRGWLIVVLVVVVLAAAAGVAYYAGMRARGNSPGSGRPQEAANSENGADTTGTLPSVFAATGGGFEGALLLKEGKLDEAIRWLDDYLASGVRRPNSDAALYYLGRAWEKKHQPDQAVPCYRRLMDDFGDSEWTAKALVRLATITADETERAKIAEALWKKFPSTSEGRKAALAWADDAYRKYCGEDPDYSKWEEVRNAYSLAVEGIERGTEERKRVVHRLARLNDALLYDPSFKSSGAFFVRVSPGDSLSAIANRHGTSVGVLKRINGLKTDIIHAGENLKVIPVKTRIVVDRGSYTLTHYLNGKFFKEYPVGIGRGNLTPAGRFVIRNKVKKPDWYPRGKQRIPFGDPRNILGTRWMGFSGTASATGLGIHGTDDPESIGRPVSAGCIRMLNEDVEELYDLTPIGSPVIIQ